MKEKIKKNQKSSSEIEEEISEIICKRIKEEKISDSELDAMVFEEIENNMSFSENWQKHYAKERIKEKVKEKKYNFIPTTRVKRFLDLILDWIGIYIFALIFGVVLGITGLYFFIEGVGDWFFGIILTVSYYVIFESIWSKTPAKFITRTKVITEYGEKPSFKTIFIRTLVRFVPFEAFTFLSPERPKGWHDRWSKTIVVDDAKKLPSVQKSEIFYCGKCGNKLDSDSKFCAKCGAKI